ncbi:hypothetical protein RB195_014795 [Necator americanus]|uniref:Uncharacterized protein n=1 Tax=Necator americanus TaxID=51031 RepID=A0ABR1E1L5_NECAM
MQRTSTSDLYLSTQAWQEKQAAEELMLRSKNTEEKSYFLIKYPKNDSVKLVRDIPTQPYYKSKASGFF